MPGTAKKDVFVAPQIAARSKEDLLDILLKNRGIEGKEREKFLNPDFTRDTYDPFLIKDMEKAAERLILGFSRNEKIAIYTDYDCDGGPAGVVLHDFFRKIGYENFFNYIPHRHKEGYGVNQGAVEKFVKEGVTLMVTADVGITDLESIKLAQEFGIDVIVTDHHLPVLLESDDRETELLPQAFAVINSKQKGDSYPDPMLCGCAVAWKLVCAVIKKAKSYEKNPAFPSGQIVENIKNIPEGWEKWLLDLVGISTIADMVPLQNENRALAYFGLKVLRKSPRLGLQKLLREVRINQETLSEEDISFMIAPRLNAASRMDNPMEAFKLLATTDEAEAEVLAEHLHNLNDNRKTSVAAIMREINAELHGSELGDVVVMGNPLWSPGVLGLLASRITEVYERPAFVWGRGDGEIIKGSSRSDGTVNIVDVMVNVRENFFLHVGGHEQAGGFSISFENVHTLEEELSRAFLKVKKLPVVENEGKVDCVLAMEKVNRATWGEVAQLAPFGVGNPKPLFLFEKAAPFLVKHFGKEKNHLELSFRTSEGRIVKAIGFFMGAHHFEKERGVIFAEGVPVDLTANIELSRFMGREEIRLRIIDVRPCM